METNNEDKWFKSQSQFETIVTVLAIITFTILVYLNVK